MSHRIVRSLFESRLKAWADARTTPLRIAYQNVSFTPATGETYLRAFTLPGTTASNTLGGDHKLYTGLFQVTIVTPPGKGPGAAETLLDELSSLYPINHALTRDGFTVLVMTPLEPGPEQQDDTAFSLPCRFEYRADTF